MSAIRMTIRSVAIILLMLVLTVSATVQAYTLEMLASEPAHGFASLCHDTDSGADHGSSGKHQSDMHCCELDSPYLLPSSPGLVTPAVTGMLASPFYCKQLDGHVRRIYKPPR